MNPFEKVQEKIPFRLLGIAVLLIALNIGGESLAKFLGSFSNTPYGKALYDTLLNFNGDNIYSKELIIELLKASDFSKEQIDATLMGGVNSIEYNFEYTDLDNKTSFIEVKFTALQNSTTGEIFYKPTIRNNYGANLKDSLENILQNLNPDNMKYTGYSIENIEKIGDCAVDTKQNANNVGAFFSQKNLMVPTQKQGTFTQISGGIISIQANVVIADIKPAPRFNSELQNCKEQ